MESVGVYWITLKPHLLPGVVAEVDNVVIKHRGLLIRARDGDSKAMKDLEFLNVSIRSRIEDLDNFYDENYLDFRMPFFEKQKFRLRRLIAESLIVDPHFDQNQEFEIITEDELEKTRKAAASDANYSSSARKGVPSLQRGSSKDTGNSGSKEKKRIIEESVNRLVQPASKVKVTIGSTSSKNTTRR